MKSPQQLAEKLARHWRQADLREQRLLDGEDWPLALSIGKPTGQQVVEAFPSVRRHVERWRRITIGEVVWRAVRFRGTAEAVELPLAWQLRTPSEWVAAINDPTITHDYRRLERLVIGSDEQFHRLLVRRLHLHTDKPETQIILATKVAMQLSPGCAEGAPLRALSVAGIDSKFLERHRRLMIALLDLRFDGAVSELGLEGFLGAADETDHWLLLADLDGQLLPFQQLRVRDKELAETPLPGKSLLIIENERCLHLLPVLSDTIAILGAGLNLAWMGRPWLAERRLAYWGDIDTWGLTMLARARRQQPHLTALLMDTATFDRYRDGRAVEEAVPASTTPPMEMSEAESQLFRRLLTLELGRLEQEFIPQEGVVDAILGWHGQALTPTPQSPS